MTSTEPRPDIFDLPADDPGSEPALLDAARAGSTAAYGILYARYRALALSWARVALPVSDASLAEDVVETAFIRVWTALGNGKGPRDGLRPYLATTVRREAWRVQRRRRRQAEVLEAWAAGEAVEVAEVEGRTASPLAAEPDGADPVVGPESHALLTEAFGGLSDRWRHVLWLTEVEGMPPTDVGPLLGVSAGSAAALAYRARRGLVAAYLGAYGSIAPTDTCRELASRLSAYLAAGADPTGFDDVVAHLDGCRSCRDLSRGVDLMGDVLASCAPFGLLTAGLWAKAVAAGAGRGAAAAAAGAGASVAGASRGAVQVGVAKGLRAGSSGASSPGVGAVAAVVAAVVVVVGGLGVALGIGGSDSNRTEGASRRAGASAATPEAPGAPGVSGEAPGSSAGSGSRSPSTSVQGAEVTSPPAGPVDPAPAVPVPAPPRASAPDVPSVAPLVPVRPPTTTTTTSTLPATTTTTSMPTTTTTTTAPTTTTTAATTTTVVPQTAALRGRVVRRRPGGDDDELVPVPGIVIEVRGPTGALAGWSATDVDGAWVVPGLGNGTYRVVAVVPTAYRPMDGPDPWAGGPIWTTTVDEVSLAGHDAVVADLRLVMR